SDDWFGLMTLLAFVPATLADAGLVCGPAGSLPAVAFVVSGGVEDGVAFVSTPLAAIEFVFPFPDCATEFVAGEFVLILAEALVSGALVPGLVTSFPEGELVAFPCSSACGGSEGKAGIVSPRLKLACTANSAS